MNQKRLQIVVIAVIIILSLSGLVIILLNNYNPPDPDSSISPTSDISQIPSLSPTIVMDDSNSELPNNWSYYYDSMLKFAAAYPANFMIVPASNRMGEAAFYSFNINKTPAIDPISSDELKIGIVYFSLEDSRSIEQGDIVDEIESVSVDNHEATQWESKGDMGTSLITSVKLNSGEKYLINAYPAYSEKIEIYDQFLRHIDLDAEMPLLISQPTKNQILANQANIQGRASGDWFFEAEFTVDLVDDQMQVIESTQLSTSQDWMTKQLVDFSGSIAFDKPQSSIGYLLFQKSNPSGMAENDYLVSWPVEFK